MKFRELQAICCVIAVLACAHQVIGLKCYACVQSGTEVKTCEKDPKSVQNSEINCNKKYCVIRRIEFVDQPGEVFSFYRGCEQRPEYINNVVTDTNFVTYYRSCTTDLCNSGDGRSGGGGSGGGNINSGGDGDGGALLVPGMGNAGLALRAAQCFIIFELTAILLV